MESLYDDKLQWVYQELLDMGYIDDEDDWVEFSKFMSETAETFFIEKNLMDLT